MAQSLIVPTAPKLESQKDSEEVRKSLLDLASKINEAILGTGREISDEALTADQKAALAGTDGTPSATNKYVTDSDPRLSGSSPYLPTADEKAALAGSSGTPSDTNRYITEADPRSAASPGGVILYSEPSQVTTTNSTPTPLRSFGTRLKGAIRVTFTILRVAGGFNANVYARIYVNGVARGTQRFGTTTATAYSEDITIVPGDTVAIYAWSTGGATCGISAVTEGVTVGMW